MILVRKLSPINKCRSDKALSFYLKEKYEGACSRPSMSKGVRLMVLVRTQHKAIKRTFNSLDLFRSGIIGIITIDRIRRTI